MKTLISALPLSAAGAAIAIAGWAMPSYALAVFGNPINPVTTSSSSVINNNNLPTPQQKAVGFTTDGRTWNLDRVVLSLTGLDSNDLPVVEIRTNDPANGGRPGATWATLTNPTLGSATGSTGNYQFVYTSGTRALDPNTTYWLFVGGNSYSWVENGTVEDPFAEPPVAYAPGPLPTAQSSSGWTFVDYKFTGNGVPEWGAGNGVRNAFRIDATEIAPVPFAFTPIPGLIISGIIGGVRRTRKSRNVEGAAEA